MLDHVPDFQGEGRFKGSRPGARRLAFDGGNGATAGSTDLPGCSLIPTDPTGDTRTHDGCPSATEPSAMPLRPCVCSLGSRW